MIRKSTWIFLLIFVGLLAAVYLWQRKEMQQEAETTPTAGASQGYLFDISGTITGVRLERVGERVLELKADDQGVWKITWPEGLDTDSETATTALAQLSAIPVVTTMTQTPDLDAMGLAQPAYRILVTDSVGKSWVASIGNTTPTNSGYYVLSSSRSVSIISTYALDPIIGLIDAPPVKQVALTPEASLVPLPFEPGIQLTPVP